MKEIVILTEEPSIKPVFDRLSQFLDPDQVYLTIITHNGVTELERSLPRKLRAWRNPNSYFLITRDNDNGDCKVRKRRLQEIVNQSGRGDRAVIRIVCQELEAWLLGDREAMHSAGILDLESNPASLRGNPDALVKPSQLLDDYLNGYPKIGGATAIAPHLNPERNISPSFNATVDALKRLAEDS